MEKEGMTFVNLTGEFPQKINSSFYFEITAVSCISIYDENTIFVSRFGGFSVLDISDFLNIIIINRINHNMDSPNLCITFSIDKFFAF
jgi:hypothetical protein